MEQTWNDLLFAHWPIAPEILRPLVPQPLALDTFDGQCWVAVTPFHMTGVRPRFLPPVPGLSAFPELNVRTYVTVSGKPGVYFFSLDAASRIAVWAARVAYRLPYYFASMEVKDKEGYFHYRSSRAGGKALLRARYRPAKPVRLRAPGTLEHWLTERYCCMRWCVAPSFALKFTMSRGPCKMQRHKSKRIRWPVQPASRCRG